MRYTGEIDAELMRDAMALSGLPTKRATIEAALRLVIREKRRSDGRDPRGKINRESDTAATRRDD